MLTTSHSRPLVALLWFHLLVSSGCSLADGSPATPGISSAGASAASAEPSASSDRPPATAASAAPGDSGTAAPGQSSTTGAPAVVGATPKLADLPREDRQAFATFQLTRMKLLADRSLQTKLQLSDEQIRALAAGITEAEVFNREITAANPKDTLTKLDTEYAPRAEAMSELAHKVLSPAQQRIVFEAVVRQQQGAIVFLMPGVSDALSLTAAQCEKVRTLMRANQAATNWDRLSNPIELSKLIMRGRAARQAAEEQLTDEQRATWKAILSGR